jgi:hypothetical protein
VSAEEGDVVGELGGDPAQPPLVLDVEPVPGLDLEMGDPSAERLRPAARCQRTQLIVGGRPRGFGRDPDAARLIGIPAIRAANSSARSPAKTRWVWLSTKPGITQRPLASKLLGCCSQIAHGDHAISSNTRFASRTIPNGPSPTEGSLVTSRPMFSIASELMPPAWRSPR